MVWNLPMNCEIMFKTFSIKPFPIFHSNQGLAFTCSDTFVKSRTVYVFWILNVSLQKSFHWYYSQSESSTSCASTIRLSNITYRCRLTFQSLNSSNLAPDSSVPHSSPRRHAGPSCIWLLGTERGRGVIWVSRGGGRVTMFTIRGSFISPTSTSESRAMVKLITVMCESCIVLSKVRDRHGDSCTEGARLHGWDAHRGCCCRICILT
jgi:hypothetical protein